MMDYPWLQPAREQLLAPLRQQRLHHAVLLHGPAGLGKLALARWLGGLLLCQRPQPDGPCGSCHGCRLFEAGNHPDWYQARAVEASQITVDRIRHINRQLASSSQLGGNKVVLIEPAEAMNEAAANALLKTLEEPTAGSFLILSAASVQRLPATIVSRCRPLRLSPPAEPVVIDWLRRQLPGAGELRPLLRLNQGAPLLTLNDYRDEIEAHRLALVAGLTPGREIDKLAWAQCYMSRPAASGRVVQHLLLDAIKCLQGVPPAYWSHCDQQDAIPRFAGRFPLLALFDGVQTLNQLNDLIATRPGINAELQVLDWLLALAAQGQ